MDAGKMGRGEKIGQNFLAPYLGKEEEEEEGDH